LRTAFYYEGYILDYLIEVYTVRRYGVLLEQGAYIIQDGTGSLVIFDYVGQGGINLGKVGLGVWRDAMRLARCSKWQLRSAPTHETR
jgi:hypothetical protein